MKNPFILALWTLIIASLLWFVISTSLNPPEPRKKWQPNPQIGHRAAHNSGNPPPYNK